MRDHTRTRLSLCVTALALAACSESSVPVAPRSVVASQAREPRMDGYIVVLKDAATFNRMRPGSRLANVIPLDRPAAAQDAIIGDAVPSIRGIVVRGAASASDLTGNDVAAVIPNYVADVIEPSPTDVSLVSDAGPADPTGTNQAGAFFFANNTQWHYKRMSANRAWVPSRGGAGANVCITDSGIDAGHTAFVGKNIIAAASAFANSSPLTDTLGHGSHVTGTISTNGAGGASVAPDVNLLIAKIFNGAGGGATTGVILAAVQWCTDNGADIINMSVGFNGGIPILGNEAFLAAFQQGLDYATSRGTLIVASAGNDGRTLPFPNRAYYPAEAQGVTSVASTGPNTNLAPFSNTVNHPIWSAPGAAFDGISNFSNRGPVPNIDLAAPGGNRELAAWPSQGLITSVCSRQMNFGTVAAPVFPCANNGFWVTNAGTSMASPHVAGVAALIRARWPSSVRSPALRNKIEACLYKSVDNIGSNAIFGRGRVNAFKAVTQPC